MIEQGTPEWLALRLGKVTASRVADVIAKTKTGVSASRANYLIELAIQRVTGTVEESFKNDAMAWGTVQEPFARMKYELDNEVLVDQVPFIDHPRIEWFGCSPDGLVGNDGLVEIKAPNSKTHWEYFKAGEAPTKYIIQMQSQMACTGREWCDFISYDPRMPERSQMLIKRYKRDEKMIADIESGVSKFLEEVAKEVELMRDK